jgi:hypothetical protein
MNLNLSLAWRRLLQVGMLVWLAAARMDAAPSLQLPAASGSPGGSVLIPLTLQGSAEVVAAQFEVTVSSASVESLAALPGLAAPGVKLDSHLISPGTRRVVLYSSTSQPLPEGPLANLPFSIASSAPTENVTVSLAKVILVGGEGRAISGVTVNPGAISIGGAAGARFNSVQLGTDGKLRLEFSASAGRSYSIQQSSDLKSWLNFATSPAAGGTVTFVDPNVLTNKARFYRAVHLP